MGASAMKILTISVYHADTDSIDLLFPEGQGFGETVRTATFHTKKAVSYVLNEPMFTSSPGHVFLTEIKQQLFYAINYKKSDSTIYLFSLDSPIDLATAYKCFARIKHFFVTRLDDALPIDSLLLELEEIISQCMTTEYVRSQETFREKKEKIEATLEEVKESLHATVEILLERGEKIEALLAKSEALSLQTTGFKTAAFRLAKRRSTSVMMANFFFCLPDGHEHDERVSIQTTYAAKIKK
jgi:hypothetical protein